MGEEQGAIERPRDYCNAVSASSEAFGWLVRATADICSPRYHYYCADREAKLPQQLVIVANTRKIPIRNNSFFNHGEETGALEAEEVPAPGTRTFQLVPTKARPGDDEIALWKDALKADLREIEKFAPGANYVCMPEFGFPYALDHQQTLEIPKGVDREWDDLQDSKYLTDRFTCLGSAHRRYFRTAEKGATLQYENVAVVYPSGDATSMSANEVFAQKLKSFEASETIPDMKPVEGVNLTFNASGEGIAATFPGAGLTAMRRADVPDGLSGVVTLDQSRFAKNAFDFYDAIADYRDPQNAPPVYIRKKSPARKIGEYIDANGRLELDVFVTHHGVIAVLICYDAFDPSIFLSAVRMYYESFERDGNFVHQGIDLFLVPAFNRSPKFVDACKFLSRETNTTVVYVSGDEGCTIRSDVFVCGENCETWAAKMSAGELDLKAGEVYYTRQTVPGHDHLHIHMIDQQIIEAARRYMHTQASPATRRGLILRGKRLGAAALG